MPLRIVLVTPARRFIGNRFGLGYQLPLGQVFIGGPLLDAGHTVRLIDNDLYGWGHARLAREVAAFRADLILLGHTGSTAAHRTALATARALKAALPEVPIAYGGVFPSYAAEDTLRVCAAVDMVVRGEGEATCLALAAALAEGRPLSEVAGLTWRDGEVIQTNRPRPPLRDLDAYRPGWELVNWSGYRLFGIGRSAGMQFSRGCPLTCTYCGQWMFWKKWRHRSPDNFVRELRILVERYGVKIVWLADENFSADREVVQDVLYAIIRADLGLSLNINMTAADVLRDADILHLYKQAGVDFIVMGVESLEDDVVASVRKNNPYQVSREAVRLLRQHDILSLVDIIYGLEDETIGKLWARFRKLCELDADMFNAVYLTPHFWTAAGRATDPRDIVQTDQDLWTYRNQVIATPHLAPWMLFAGIKLTEALFHLRPRGLVRLVHGGEPRARRILRAWLGVGIRVVLAEIAEFIFATRFSPRGTLAQIPGASTTHASSTASLAVGRRA